MAARELRHRVGYAFAAEQPLARTLAQTRPPTVTRELLGALRGRIALELRLESRKLGAAPLWGQSNESSAIRKQV